MIGQNVSHSKSTVASSIVVAFTILLFIPLLTYSQITRLQFQQVTVEQGLSHPNVKAICQDSTGFIWFGTSSGLDRFDGREIKSIEMGQCDVLSTAKNGDLWVAASALFCMSVARDTTVHYGDFYQAAIVSDDDSTIWIGGELGLFHLNPKNGQIIRMGAEAKAEEGVTSMAMDKRGNLWLVTPSSVLYFEKTSQRSRFISSRSIGTYSRMAIAPDGTVWIVGGPAGQLCKIDPATSHLVDVLENDAQVSAKSIAVDASGLVYVGTWASGLKIYNPKTRDWETYKHSESDPQSLIDDNVNQALFDRDGNLWLATGGGVSWSPRWRRSFSRISAHTPDEEIRPAEIRDIVEDKRGNLWLGTGGGLKKWDRKKETVSAVKSVNARISCLGMVHQEQLWIALARERSLMRLDTRLGTSDNLPSEVSLPELRGQISAMFNDGDTTMWLGCTRGKIYRHDLRTGRTVPFTYETPEQLFPHHIPYVVKDRPRLIYRDRRGVLWIATGFGLLSLDEQSGMLKRHIHSREASPSPIDNILSIYEDTKGRFWVGNGMGLDLFDRSEGTFLPILHSSQPRKGKTVIGILEDETGTLWLQTDGMLLRYNHDTGELKQYGPKDGFPITYLLTVFLQGTRACYATSEGEFALGVSNEIVLFRPDGLWENPNRPTVAITGVEVFDKSSQVSSQSISIFVLPKQPLTLGASHNAIEIKFAGLDYAMPRRIQYAVWLEPPDRSWAKLGTENSVRFVNLSPGSYRLRVKAANGDSGWSNIEASYRFEVLAPWWMMWWFRSLGVVFVLSFMGFVYRREVRRLKREKRVQQEFSRKQIEQEEFQRKSLASELHDGLGQDLLIVNNELQQFLSSGDGSREDLKRVSALMQESIEGVREISSNLHPHHIERLGFCAAVEAMVEKLSHSSPITFQCTCEKIDMVLPKGSEIHLYRIIQESLSNIVKHSGATSSRLDIRKETNTIEVMIADNGRGFKLAEFVGPESTRGGPTEIARGFGIASVSERARIIGAKLKIESTPQRGTTVLLSIRIPEKE